MLIGRAIRNRRQNQQQKHEATKRLSEEERQFGVDQTITSDSRASEINLDPPTTTATVTEKSRMSETAVIEPEAPSLSSTHVKIPPFYLNILLLNKEEVVGNKVADKTGNGFLGRAAIYFANKMIKDEVLLTNIAKTLIHTVEKAIDEMGIRADFAIKFSQGPLVVIKIQIIDIDILQLILSAKGPEFASNFSRFHLSVQKLGLEGTVFPKIHNKINSGIGDGMIQKFNDLIPLKMAEKGVKVDCHSCTTEEQAEVFFNLYEKLAQLNS